MGQSVKIKFCGLRTEEDIAFVNEVMPDFAGFILTARFWRYVPPEEVKRLRGLLDKNIKVVGVVVDEPLDYVASLLNDNMVDIIQLHGHEDNEYIAALRRAAPNRRIHQAFKIESAESLAEAERSDADLVLLDSGTGSGVSFDWSLVADAKRPFFLAGGLNPENVTAAIAQVKPYAVDVSSGIETDKRKDGEKMRAFAAAVRNI